MDADLDLGFEQLIRAPRTAVWAAWTDPAQFAQWWLPAPMTCRVERLDVVAGGALVTSMSEDGIHFVPHMDACFLAADEGERVVYTNAVDSHGRPVDPQPVAVTAEITLRDHPDGTMYGVVARHRDAASRERHEQLGFHDAWGTVVQQLADVAERSGR